MGTHERDARTPTSELPAQSRRLGKYELIAEIGMGGMAAVYLARLVGPMNFEKVVVVKTIHPHLAREEEFIHMLLDEARISALIKHPNVVDIYDLGVANGTYFIAMEYLAGQPLSQLLKQGSKGKKLDPYTAAAVIQQAAGGLHAAHSLTTMSGEHLELIHRDVSPGNIMVLYDGTVKLLDFGVSKARGRITASETGQLKGKIGYVAPEQVAGDVKIDARVDVYSLGVVLWELLTYKRLFYNDSQAATLKQISEGDVSPPSRVRSDVPKALEDICLKAMALRPDDRFQSAEDLRRALVDVLRSADYDVHEMPTYMKETFAAQRSARARLLREVAGADAVAFEVDLQEVDVDPPEFVPEGTPVRSGSDKLPLPGVAQAAAVAAAGGAPGGASGGAPGAGEAGSAPGTGDVGSAPGAGEAGAQAATSGEPSTDTALNAVRARSRGRVGVWLAAGVALGALVVFLLLGSGGDEQAGRVGQQVAASAPADRETAAERSAGKSRGASAGAPGAAEDSGADPPAGAGQDEVAGGLDGGDHRAGDPGETGDEQDAAADSADADSATDADSASANVARRRADARRARRARAEAERLYREGVKLYVAGKASKARAMFRRALDADGDYAPAYRGLGLVHERLGRKDKAVQWLRRYLRAVPRAKDAREIRARIDKLRG